MDSHKPVPLTATGQPAFRDILGPLAAGFYALFALLPDSSSLLVSWPWVFVWQVALLLPWFWLLRHWWVQNQVTKLGYKLDCGVGLAVVGLLGSSLLAPFPQQARWYGWAALCALAALYALNAWCASPERRLKLLTAQGGLSIAFIAVSLSLWIGQTLLPELSRLNNLRVAGLNLSYDFSVLELRNWAPIGHQNYVAGYLVLSLPLLLGLTLISKTQMRWVWGAGTLLGLADLYTTSSRGGWLGTALVGVSGGLLLLGHRRLPLRVRWTIGLALLAGLFGIVLANNRLRSLFFAATSDSAGGETAFRLITNATGWAIGLAHPFFGAGPGSVPLLYQAYRPAWAGREAELVYQLHSTPAQIWAELGAVGMGLSIAMVGWLGYWGVRLWRAQPAESNGDRILTWSLLAGLAGYGVVSITDYQLDIVCISGTLVVYLAGFLSLLRQYLPSSSGDRAVKTARIAWLCWGIVGLLIAVGIWLAPIHRAWQLSSLGFAALSQKQIEPFQNYLEQAHRLAPWEPYYSYQLGWNLSTATSQDARVNRTRRDRGLEFFKRNVRASPHQEAGTSSLGWLQMFSRQPSLATASFLQSTRLMPAKRGVFYSLGISLLGQGKTDLGVQAIALEIVRDPLFLTSPLLRTSQLNSTYPKIQNAVVSLYQQMLKAHPQQDSFTAYLHQCLGGVYWWQGKLIEADAEWRKNGSSLSQTVLAISKNNKPPTEVPILKAWLDPQNRTQWVAKALLQTRQALPDPKEVQVIQTGMDRSKSFDMWVKQNAPLRQSPRERAGFGVLSRHIDGPAPTDFFPIVENVAMTQFLAELLPSPSYSPDLDNALQPFRGKLWQSIAPTQAKL
ncbi:O-antigen ligase family protein [Altericista sp. CCNU0014]|uniref:O-antigen ligase family protein n=1 Tax=Altericista sp. CCNU0014 TaxID=3082949 RepID=UPI00384BE5CC